MRAMRAAPLLLIACLFLTAGCAGTANMASSNLEGLPVGATTEDGSLRLVSTLPAPAGTRDGTEQLLSPNDVLEVKVFQADSLNRTVQIDSAGRISLPLIGVVQAGGKTLRQLEEELRKAYGASYLQLPDITVFLKDSAGQRVTVDGEVTKPGLYPVTAGTTLLESIAMAGGFRDIADPSKIYVFRDGEGGKLVANYDVAEIRSGRRPNPRIYGGDVVMVFTSQTRVAMNNLKDALGVAVNVSRMVYMPW